MLNLHQGSRILIVVLPILTPMCASTVNVHFTILKATRHSSCYRHFPLKSYNNVY